MTWTMTPRESDVIKHESRAAAPLSSFIYIYIYIYIYIVIYIYIYIYLFIYIFLKKLVGPTWIGLI